MDLHPVSRRLVRWIFTLASGALFSAGTAQAVGLDFISKNLDAKYTMLRYSTVPVSSVDTATPQALIQLAKDHQLFLKAYNDYTDLNRNGQIDATEAKYNHAFDYYGYFDSYKCYRHVSSVPGTSLHGFVPTTTHDKNSALPDEDPSNVQARYCSGTSDEWSGNFLNWATMTRIDVVRKILFGGRRVVDESLSTSARASLTVLERSYLPNDAHSFAKYYGGSDLRLLTPFAAVTTAADPRDNGLTICNTTLDPTFSLLSTDVTEAPLMRVARGNYTLWAANERWQCLWNDSGEKNAENSNVPEITGIQAYSANPVRAQRALSVGSAIRAGDLAVRVQSCAIGFEEGDRCKQYPDGTFKPIGLLQEFGDTDRLLFGLVAGTYSKNKSGGDVMKNVSSITNEVNVAGSSTSGVTGDGRFILTAGLKSLDGSTITTTAKAADMINGLSLYRIIKYRHGRGSGDDAGSEGTYGTKAASTDNCPFALDGFKDGECQNWGNPFAEGFLASLRYFSGQPPSGDFRNTDQSEIKGLNPPQAYKYSVDDTNACTDLNVVAFNNSSISYDGDQLDDTADGVSTVGSSVTSQQLTDLIGVGENIHGKRFFVGEIGPGSDQLCTSKVVGSLGSVKGICPEAPRLEGTFRIAGLAYHAHTTGIATKGPASRSTRLKVKTYAVNLASAVPTIDIPVPNSPSRRVTILPACANQDLVPAGRVGACGLVDFKVIEAHTVSNGIGKGKFYVNWEVGEQGGDFDQDMSGVLSYEIDGAEIRITTDTFADSSPRRLGFGFIVSGTLSDGFHAYSGVGEASGFTRLGSGGILGCNNCLVSDPPVTQRFTLGTSDTSILKDPLWYAAKWGGFKDSNNNNVPDLASEWDKVDADGDPNPDGVPDNYFFAVEPRQLEEQLRRVFSEIAGQIASGTAAAVVANAREGEGALYQALFESSRVDRNGTEARWLGTVHGLWVDPEGRLREDDGDARLEDFAADQAVELFFDESVDPARTRVRRFTGDPADGVSVVVEIDRLRTLWNARDRLSELTNTDTQRNYSDLASTGRHIKTYIDRNLDGRVDDGEFVDFLPSSFGITSTGGTVANQGTYGILNTDRPHVAQAIIGWVRGNDRPTVNLPANTKLPPLRNRTLDYDGDGDRETMRLGDIVNSTPTLVAQPAEAFDLLYDDDSYRIFRQRLRNRRHVVYVGGNDGMIHAFNGGVFSPGQNGFVRGTPAHPLGTELWSYVPYSVLPHLTWLSDPAYAHVSYIDGKPRVFDARIYGNKPCSDTLNPCGWATVLVVGLRFGGGDIGLPVATGNGGNRRLTDAFKGFTGLTDASPALRTSSAFVILDVTNPDQPPKLLGEIRHPEFGFTTSYPTVISHSKRGTKSTAADVTATAAAENWYLVFGNGPNNLDTSVGNNVNNLDTAISNRTGKVFVLDLKALALNNTVSFVGPDGPTAGQKYYDLTTNATTGAPNSFVGDPVTADWDLDFKANAVYFGTIANTTASPEGKLFKFDLSVFETPTGQPPQDVEKNDATLWTRPKVMVNAGVPSVSTPTLTFDEFGRRWVMAGTGRLYGDPDKVSPKKQYLFGFVDSRLNTAAAPAPMYDFANFVDVSAAVVRTTGDVTGVTGATTESALAELIVRDGTDADTLPDRGGWRLDLQVPAVSPGGSERSLNQMSLLGDILFATTFTPATDTCGGQGRSNLYGLFYRTGAGRSTLPPFGTLTTTTGTVLDTVKRQIDAGVGLASAPSLKVGGARDQRGLTIFSQTSTGAIEQRDAVIREGARSGEMDWRELY